MHSVLGFISTNQAYVMRHGNRMADDEIDCVYGYQQREPRMLVQVRKFPEMLQVAECQPPGFCKDGAIDICQRASQESRNVVT
jgi:hypothetical protein